AAADAAAACSAASAASASASALRAASTCAAASVIRQPKQSDDAPASRISEHQRRSHGKVPHELLAHLDPGAWPCRHGEPALVEHERFREVFREVPARR